VLTMIMMIMAMMTRRRPREEGDHYCDLRTYSFE